MQTMQIQTNTSTVQQIYEAFGKGDIATIMDKLADKVDWEYAYRDAPNPVPWFQSREDKAGVGKFFESLAALEFHSFVPKTILEGTDLVVALCDIEATVKETGKRIVEQDEVHIWYFSQEGLVVRFRHCADTYQQAMACQG